MKLKENTGITLIALVVTIIVLLILAGVTLSLALDSNGVFQRSKNAASVYKSAEEEERAELDRVAGEMDEAMKEKISWKIVNDSDSNETLSIGDEVKTSTGERFFVLNVDDDTATLIAKYNLALQKNSSGKYYQDDAPYTETACAFSSEKYWTTPDLNNETGYAEGDAMDIAVKYGTQLGGRGRLITRREALDGPQDIIDGSYVTEGELHYWFGEQDVYLGGVWKAPHFPSSHDRFSSASYEYDEECGVRAVVEIPASNF